MTDNIHKCQIYICINIYKYVCIVMMYIDVKGLECIADDVYKCKKENEG